MEQRPSAGSIGVRDERGSETVITREQFCRALGVEGWVRLHEGDFAELSTMTGTFVHFNIESANHLVGKRYGLVPILRAGARLADGGERLPIVDMSRCKVAMCLEIAQRVPVDEVRQEHFDESLPSIRSAAELRQALVRRYAALFPRSSPQELVARGCAVTRFRFI